MKDKKKTNLRLNGKTRMFIITMPSMRRHNRCYDYENNNKYSQKPKKAEMREESFTAKYTYLFSKNFIYDPLNVFYKPMGTIDNRIMR